MPVPTDSPAEELPREARQWLEAAMAAGPSSSPDTSKHTQSPGAPGWLLTTAGDGAPHGTLLRGKPASPASIRSLAVPLSVRYILKNKFPKTLL